MVPVNTTATVGIPFGKLAVLQVNGGPASKVDGVMACSVPGGAVVCEVGSGEYVFTVPARPFGGS